MTEAEKTPNPGSDEALDAGCTCPVLDNAHGKGYMGGVFGGTVFVYMEGCPVHEPLRPPEAAHTEGEP
jgi:hypothetical protein